MAKVIDFYVRDLFPKKVKPVARGRCGEVIQFPNDSCSEQHSEDYRTP